MYIESYLAIPLWIFGMFGFIYFLLRVFDHLGSGKRLNDACTLIISAKNQEEAIEGVVLGFIMKACLNETSGELLHIVLVDLSSHDETPQLMKLLADQYPFIRLMKPCGLIGHFKALL